MEYIDNEDEDELDINLKNFIDFVNITKICEDREEFKLLISLISKIIKNHHFSLKFFDKIKQIIICIESDIKRTFSNSEIFNLFKKNKRALLFLINQKFIILDQSIINYIIEKIDKNGTRYRHYFYPELKPLINQDLRNFIENEFTFPEDMDKFEEKRKACENDSYICELIRNDSVTDFIIYVNKKNINLNSSINPSIFETNSYLIENNPTLIEYAAFFGSIEIFQYLSINNVELNSKLWLFAIHGQNPSIIHLLEENEVQFPSAEYNEINEFIFGYRLYRDQGKDIKNCLIESIKCHHNNIANYFRDNYCIETHFQIDMKNMFLNYINSAFKFYNFEFLPDELNYDFDFFYACRYNYVKLVDLFLKTNKTDINKSYTIEI